MEDKIQCDNCGVIYNSKDPHDEKDCLRYQELNSIQATCGTYQTLCPCNDCETYFSDKVIRPLIDKDISKEELDKLNNKS